MTKKVDGTLKIQVVLKVYDAKHRLVHHQCSHSIVKQFLQMLKCFMCSAAEGSVKDTGGTIRTLYSYTTGGDGFARTPAMFCAQAGANSTTYGIILGTGTTAVTYVDYVIETIIADGTGSGQLSYAAMGYTALSDITGGQHFKLTRVITNSSGASITVNEIALYGRGRISSSYIETVSYFCMERTVLGTPITIADTESYTFEYDISLTI